jgi:phosphoserine phosphatase
VNPPASTGAPCDDSAPPYGTLIFDCDSTLSGVEGIDELAGPRKPEISRLTERAMAGEVPLEAVYGKRLEMLRPDRAAVEALGRKYVAAVLPHAREVCDALHSLGKRTCIVSGGLRQAVFALSSALGIPDEDVFAVDVFHGRDGAYAGYDEESPLTTTRGKLEVVRALAKADRKGGVAFVGDGATDLEAAPAARRFVAFGGVVRRPEVFARAAVTCDRPDLAALLPLLCAPDEIDALARDPRHLALIHAARRHP